jgi:NAD(P)-dependent dehydrogenase (short-subunit alcohol dehydrogenase family)
MKKRKFHFFGTPCNLDIKHVGGNATPIYCDHSKPEEIQKLFAQIEQETHGTLDILVNNAFSGGQVSIQRILNVHTKNFRACFQMPVKNSLNAIHCFGMMSIMSVFEIIIFVLSMQLG